MTNKLYILATLSLMVISPSRGYGQMKDSSSLFLPLMEHLSPMSRHSDMSRKNPAIHAEACSTDFSTAEAGYSMRREDMPATVQNIQKTFRQELCMGTRRLPQGDNI